MAFGARFLKRDIDEQIKLPISSQWKAGTPLRRQGSDEFTSTNRSWSQGLQPSTTSTDWSILRRRRMSTPPFPEKSKLKAGYEVER